MSTKRRSSIWKSILMFAVGYAAWQAVRRWVKWEAEDAAYESIEGSRRPEGFAPLVPAPESALATHASTSMAGTIKAGLTPATQAGQEIPTGEREADRAQSFGLSRPEMTAPFAEAAPPQDPDREAAGQEASAEEERNWAAEWPTSLAATERPAEPVDQVPMTSAPAAAGMESIEAEPRSLQRDDLEIIEGIGPKIAQVLRNAKISTFDQLADAGQQRLEEILREASIWGANAETWAEQARLAAAGNWDELETLKQNLKGGRKA